MTDQISPQPAPNVPLTTHLTDPRDYRVAHAAILEDVLHPDRPAKLAEYTRLIEAKHPDKMPTGPDALTATVDAVIEEAMQPLGEADYERVIGPSSTWARNLPVDAVEGGWDTDLQALAATAMHKAELNEGQALSFVHAFSESQAASPETVARWQGQSLDMLREKYGSDTKPAFEALMRVVREVCDPQLAREIEDGPLGVHPRVIRELAAVAEKRGYIKRSA